MSRLFKVCIDKELPVGRSIAAARRAIAENPANLPVVRFRPGVGAAPLPPQRMALLAGKKWKPGRTLRVRFVDGDPDVHSRVKKYAVQWMDHANLRIEFSGALDAEVRVSFTPDGSWSYIGTDAMEIAPHEPTMNFGWLTPAEPDEEYSRVVLHEFGHALGCIHEHQHPEAGIPWDKEAVYAYYMGPPNNWTKEDVDNNIFETYGRDITQFSAFDTKSIMLYSVPNELTLGNYEVGWNTTLSGTDKGFIGVVYPRGKKAVPVLEVGAPWTEAAIGRHAEEDLYECRVGKEDRYVVETEGPTDVVMSLLGPDSESNLIAEDDDSGRGLNARIRARLRPAVYYVRVRHYMPAGTGGYKIRFRAA